MTVERGDVKGRIGVFVDGVDAGAVFEQRFRARMTAVDGRQMKRRSAIQRHRVHVRALLQQQLQTFPTVRRDGCNHEGGREGEI